MHLDKAYCKICEEWAEVSYVFIQPLPGTIWNYYALVCGICAQIHLIVKCSD